MALDGSYRYLHGVRRLYRDQMSVSDVDVTIPVCIYGFSCHNRLQHG